MCNPHNPTHEQTQNEWMRYTLESQERLDHDDPFSTAEACGDDSKNGAHSGGGWLLLALVIWSHEEGLQSTWILQVSL